MRRASAGGEGLSVRTFALEAPPQVGVDGFDFFVMGFGFCLSSRGGGGGVS